jgi:hypothetical protein
VWVIITRGLFGGRLALPSVGETLSPGVDIVDQGGVMFGDLVSAQRHLRCQHLIFLKGRRQMGVR